MKHMWNLALAMLIMVVVACAVGGAGVQQFYFYSEDTIDGSQPSYFEHGWQNIPIPHGVSPQAYCLEHATFVGEIDGMPTEGLTLVVQPDKTHGPGTWLCLYSKHFPANYFSEGEHSLLGIWWKDKGTTELSGTLTVIYP